jgi:hypothetical protein
MRARLTVVTPALRLIRVIEGIIASLVRIRVLSLRKGPS